MKTIDFRIAESFKKMQQMKSVTRYHSMKENFDQNP